MYESSESKPKMIMIPPWPPEIFPKFCSGICQMFVWYFGVKSNKSEIKDVCDMKILHTDFLLSSVYSFYYSIFLLHSFYYSNFFKFSIFSLLFKLYLVEIDEKLFSAFRLLMILY